MGRAGWRPGGSVGFLIEGTGERTAISHETGAPRHYSRPPYGESLLQLHPLLRIPTAAALPMENPYCSCTPYRECLLQL